MTLQDHQPRIDRANYDKTAPAVTVALRALSKAVEDSGLDKALTELIKVRASQINGCVFCLQYHLNLARQLGVAPVKLDQVAVWREAGVFSPRERAALAWTEAMTRLAEDSVSDAVYAELREQFSESEIAFLTAAVGVINAWNRIAGALRFAPPAAS